MSVRRIAALATLAVLAACGGAQSRADLFSPEWTENRSSRDIEAVRKRLAGTRPPPSTDIALGVGASGDKLVGLLLDSGTKWTVTHPLDARPVLTGQVVVGSGGGKVFALDARTGKTLWERPTGGLPLIGAGDDGTFTVITLGRGNGPGSTLLAVSRDGDVRRQIETDKELGVPAVLGGLAFIPWGNQYVSIFDIVAGDEPARVLLREKTTRAWTQGGELFFGEVGIFRFDEHIKDAPRRGASHVGLPPRELPGTPLLFPPIEERVKVAAGARDRTRLYARPVPATPSGVDIAAQRFYGTYFKFVMGFESSRGALSWVHTHASDVLGGAASEEGLVICDDQGKVTFLGAKQGQPMGERDLGEAVKSCTVQVDSLHMSGATGAPPPALAAQIATALGTRDPQLATAKRLLIREVAGLEDEGATKALLDLLSDPHSSSFLAPDIRAALAGRRTGARYMIAALEHRYDFLKNVLKPPPVGPIAQALRAMKDKSAAPILASHLLDPANPEEDIKDVAVALSVLAGPSELPQLKQFFVLSYASLESEPMVQATVAVAQTILHHGGKDGRALIDRAIASPMTVPAIKEKLQALLESQSKKPEAEKK
jgi:outer membrane protein assembly factor BamB